MDKSNRDEMPSPSEMVSDLVADIERLLVLAKEADPLSVNIVFAVFIGETLHQAIYAANPHLAFSGASSLQRRTSRIVDEIPPDEIRSRRAPKPVAA